MGMVGIFSGWGDEKALAIPEAGLGRAEASKSLGRAVLGDPVAVEPGLGRSRGLLASHMCQEHPAIFLISIYIRNLAG
jgi:hypothetical protein